MLYHHFRKRFCINICIPTTENHKYKIRNLDFYLNEIVSCISATAPL